MTIRYVEHRTHSWNGCADGIISKLQEKGVKKGQLLWIDAHNNGPDSEAIMSAFWDDAVKGEETPLSISYHVKNDHDNWYEFYENASQFLATLPPENVISVTTSCNYGGRAIMFVFYHECQKLSGNDRQKIWFSHETSFSYETAANKVIAKMINDGAKAGQIIAIDVHNNDNRGDARFCAFFNRGLSSRGDLNNMIQFKGKNDTDSWLDHYKWASNVIYNSETTLNTHSITSCCNYGGNGVTYVFIEEDVVLDVHFKLNEGKISESKPKVVATLKNKNECDDKQTMKFKYSETTGTSSSNTSSFIHELGVSLKVGVAFNVGLPKVGKGKFSSELTTSYKHTWGQEYTYANDFSQDKGADVEVVASKNTEAICEFTVQEAKLEVPYVMTLKSGRTSSGTWKGVSCWGLSAKFSSKPL